MMSPSKLSNLSANMAQYPQTPSKYPYSILLYRSLALSCTELTYSA